MVLPRFSLSWIYDGNNTYERLPISDHKFSTESRRQSFLRQNLVSTASILVLLSTTIILFVRLVNLRIYSPMDDYQIINPFPPVAHDRPNVTQPDPNTLAVVSTLYSNNYAISTAVLAHSIRSANSTARLILLYIDGQVSEEALCMSKAAGWELLAVPRIAPPKGGKGVYYRFLDQYTKLNIWGLDKHGIDRLVYLDADTLVRRNFDELFDLPFNFAAVPDVYGPDSVRGFSLTFNAGVMAIRTSSVVLEHMKKKIGTARYPIGQAEQAFLNLYFGAKAVRLPYIYNALLSIKKRSPVVWEELQSDLSVVHYTDWKPFLLESQPGEKILTHEETETAMDIAQRDHEQWAEEFGWWRGAYRSLIKERGIDLRKCSIK